MSNKIIYIDSPIERFKFHQIVDNIAQNFEYGKTELLGVKIIRETEDIKEVEVLLENTGTITTLIVEYLFI